MAPPFAICDVGSSTNALHNCCKRLLHGLINSPHEIKDGCSVFSQSSRIGCIAVNALRTCDASRGESFLIAMRDVKRSRSPINFNCNSS